MTSGDRESERLTALGGLAALSLDAPSSAAYGPEAIVIVLTATPPQVGDASTGTRADTRTDTKADT